MRPLSAVAVCFMLALGAGCPGPEDTGETGDVDTDTDSDSDSDSDSDTGEGPCRIDRAVFTRPDGSTQDVTSFLQSGEYLTLSVPGTLEVCPGTWFARLVLRADIDVVGLGDKPADTILSGGEQGTVIDVAGPNVTVTVRNVTLDRGAGLQPEHNSGGGGVYCEQEGVVDIADTVFTNGFANDGAGLYARKCDVTLKDSIFRDNVSEDDGGAITLWDSTGTFTNITVTQNRSLDGGAMAIFNSTLTVRGSEFSDNIGTQFSAGIWLYDSNLTMIDSTLSGNDNQGADYGGGLLVQGEATLDNVSFTGNSARRGGGIYVNYDAIVTGDGCDFSGNTNDDIFAASTTGGRTHKGNSNTTIRCADNACTVR